MRPVLRLFGLICLVVAAALWFLSRPISLPIDAMAGLTGNAEKGEAVFWAGGCASCHAAPGSTGDAYLILSGGYRIESPFGTFLSPNISPGPKGIAGWTTQDLANALIAGVSPKGQHLYPSLPYTTYVRMKLQDVVDLKAFLDGLPASDTDSLPHELAFPFTIRRGLGLWKRLNMSSDWHLDTVETPEVDRGRYLVEALGHCAECHTPRNIVGGLDRTRWMQGAPNPSGKGSIPSISPDKLTWSTGDIAYYLETGFTPEYDSAGGQMAKVIAGMEHLSPEDRMAIAHYLTALP